MKPISSSSSSFVQTFDRGRHKWTFKTIEFAVEGTKAHILSGGHVMVLAELFLMTFLAQIITQINVCACYYHTEMVKFPLGALSCVFRPAPWNTLSPLLPLKHLPSGLNGIFNNPVALHPFINKKQHSLPACCCTLPRWCCCTVTQQH